MRTLRMLTSRPNSTASRFTAMDLTMSGRRRKPNTVQPTHSPAAQRRHRLARGESRVLPSFFKLSFLGAPNAPTPQGANSSLQPAFLSGKQPPTQGDGWAALPRRPPPPVGGYSALRPGAHAQPVIWEA